MNISLSQYTDILFCENLERYMEGVGEGGGGTSLQIIMCTQ